MNRCLSLRPLTYAFLVSLAAAAHCKALPLQITEILARNSSGIEDGFGQREDWIEIHNPNATAQSLDGWFLTDSAGLPNLWRFPAATSIAGGDYLLVFASGQNTVDPDGNPHTNFSLSGDGEYLALVQPDGATVESAFSPAFPEQFSDVSYGVPAAGGDLTFFQASTPGAANDAPAFPGVVKDTSFDVDRGFYSAPFQLTISSATPGAEIRYTADGSLPSETNGTTYSAPIEITTTSVIRAYATFADWLPTNVDSHTYIFVDDVVRQPSNPPGWRSDWTFDSQVGQIISADYEMDARVVDNTNGLGVYTVQEALLDLPSVSITMDQEDVTGATRGIYTKPRDRVEFIGSIEYIRPDGTPGFQEDCIVETHGNSSRTPFRMQKHSLRITFDSLVGTSKLRYPLFPDSDVEEFNKLVLRACFTDSWALNTWSTDRYRPNDSLYMRDVWMKESQRAMGHPSGTGDFVHLYVNGLYFGLHDLTERIEDDWYADHIGGEKLDWEVNQDFQSPGPLWNSMMATLNGNIASAAVYAQAEQLIDIDNYIDYILLHMYADSEDFLASNGYAAANAVSGDGKWRFQIWDQELALDEFKWFSPNPTEALSRGQDRYTVSSGGLAPFQRLRQNADFRQRFADRVHRHLFNGGALSLTEASTRFIAISEEIDKAIVAESARWGDTQAGTVGYGDTAGSSNDPFADFWPPAINSGDNIYFTREQHWLLERDFVVNTYMPIIYDAGDQRGILNEMRINGLYPSIDPPAFSQHGGNVPTGFDLLIGSSSGDIYFTTDGSDPRLPGGAISASANILSGGTITDTFVAFEASGWTYLDTGADLGASDAPVTTADWRHPAFDDSAWPSGQAMLGYGGVGSGANQITINTTIDPSTNPRNATTYLRHEFELTGEQGYTDMEISVIHDDGAIIYINGNEIARSNVAAGSIAFDQLALSSLSGTNEYAPNTFTYSIQPGDLVEGTNVIAVDGKQGAINSSDFGIDLEIKATRPNPSTSGATLTETGIVQARTLNNGEWSALTSAEFIVGTAADATNIVVSQLFYNPPGSDESTEWIELMNISGGTVDLTGIAFVGIDYAFPIGTVLPAGERIIAVRDQAAFAAAYDTGGLNIAAGDFSTTALNNGGEELAVIASDGITDIRRFTYDDQAPWPTAPDGDGYALVLIAPPANPDHGVASNWRSSASTGGSPGTGDTVTFTGDPHADGDSDGMSAFLEHALGSLAGDTELSSESYPIAGTAIVDGVDYLTVTYRRNLAADDALIEVQVSTDLTTWTTIRTIPVSTSPNGDGTETVTHRSTTPLATIPREFIRLRATSRP